MLLSFPVLAPFPWAHQAETEFTFPASFFLFLFFPPSEEEEEEEGKRDSLR